MGAPAESDAIAVAVVPVGISEVAVVAVEGDLDAAQAGALRECFGALLAGGRRHVVVDLSAVPALGAAGLAALVELFVKVRIGPGDVRLCGLQPWVAEVFRWTELDRVFDTFVDRRAAVASFGG